jgi:hypothetical protein
VLGIGGPVTLISATIEVLGIILLILTVYLTIRLDWTAIGKKLKRDNNATKE